MTGPKTRHLCQPRKRVCLITPAHLATNPRAVKEADALHEAGYDVTVFACQYQDDATVGDELILQRAKWRACLLDWSAYRQPYLYWKSRLRQHACRLFCRWTAPPLCGVDRASPGLVLRAYDRVMPELSGLVLRHAADLYIAHNLQALPIAVAAARKHRARVGFDAEDFHSGMQMPGKTPDVMDLLTAYMECQCMPKCDYITAASPGIAASYAAKYTGISSPVPILNVFPLWQRARASTPSHNSSPLQLYWYSQTIGANRGLEDVLRAMAMLPGRQLELHLRGHWQVGYRDQLLGLAAAIGVNPACIVCHPWAPPDDMVRLASHFDIGLALEPGRDENNSVAQSNKLFTYLLAGNAVVATATPGQQAIVDIVWPAARSYRPGDVQALARHLCQWLNDRAALQEARRQAWAWGERAYNWDVEKQKFLQVIETIWAPSCALFV